jgi:DNA-binding protein H-NS
MTSPREFDLQSLSVEELISLDAAIGERIASRKKKLEAELALIRNYGDEPSGPRRRGIKKGTKLKAKFISPSGETWSGRGLQPKWLKEFIAQGIDPDKFLVR